MTISQQFAIDCGEIRLSVSARDDLEAKTLYMLCVRGIQAVLNSELLEVEQDKTGHEPGANPPGSHGDHDV